MVFVEDLEHRLVTLESLVKLRLAVRNSELADRPEF